MPAVSLEFGHNHNPCKIFGTTKVVKLANYVRFNALSEGLWKVNCRRVAIISSTAGVPEAFTFTISLLVS
jgi:hypothetical protein